MYRVRVRARIMRVGGGRGVVAVRSAGVFIDKLHLKKNMEWVRYLIASTGFE